MRKEVSGGPKPRDGGANGVDDAVGGDGRLGDKCTDSVDEPRLLAACCGEEPAHCRRRRSGASGPKRLRSAHGRGKGEEVQDCSGARVEETQDTELCSGRGRVVLLGNGGHLGGDDAASEGG
jgi:hypothetical protein